MKKKLIGMMLVLAMMASLLTACGKSNSSSDSNSTKKAKSESSENLTSDGKAKKACYITNSPLGNDFTDSIWSGFQAMKDKGWEVKSIEVSEEGEYAEQIRAMAAEGYTAIFTMFDEVSDVALELADELKEEYPEPS